MEFYEAKRLEPQNGEMDSVAQLDILIGMKHILGNEIGKLTAIIMLLKSFIWDPIFNRPVWKPELFDLPNDEVKEVYQKKFEDLTPFICLFTRLKKKYNKDKVQIIMAKLSVPASVPYLGKTFKAKPNITDIDEFRQDMTNYLGNGIGFEWTEKVSLDKQEVVYRFTRCAYIEILQAYGMDYAASMVCYCDHIIFDNNTPELYFSRNHCKGVGDSYCDHHYKIRKLIDDENNDKRYGDTEKAPYDAIKIIKDWEKNYKDNNGKFKW
ncbi:L-2-amino-thiazoline-4-carboxylic acid hydrolase [Dethiothermospora halolimnae]|uniref:L-2-amino-thiazoline-4-carboxylic acid hydrolase n=1 Tax=Dethiothermospora halolimnae TaxID=3114390 RepID=UPI003CCBA7B5